MPPGPAAFHGGALADQAPTRGKPQLGAPETQGKGRIAPRRQYVKVEQPAYRVRFFNLHQGAFQRQGLAFDADESFRPCRGMAQGALTAGHSGGGAGRAKGCEPLGEAARGGFTVPRRAGYGEGKRNKRLAPFLEQGPLRDGAALAVGEDGGVVRRFAERVQRVHPLFVSAAPMKRKRNPLKRRHPRANFACSGASMVLLFVLTGIFCLGAAICGLFNPGKVAFFFHKPSRAKVVGSYLLCAALCALAVLLMTPGMGDEPATRRNSRSRYAMPMIPPALLEQAGQQEGQNDQETTKR